MSTCEHCGADKTPRGNCEDDCDRSRAFDGDVEPTKLEQAVEEAVWLEGERSKAGQREANCRSKLNELGEKSLFSGCWLSADRKVVVIAEEGTLTFWTVDDASKNEHDGVPA